MGVVQGSAARDTGVPANDIDVAIVIHQGCQDCQHSERCANESVWDGDETIKAITPKCERGFYELLKLTRQLDEGAMLYDLKIISLDAYVPGEGIYSEVVSTINRHGWHQFTYCGEGDFFWGSKLIYQQQNESVAV